MAEEWLTRSLFALIGVLMGLTGAMAYLHRQVSDNKQDTAVQQEQIKSAHRRLNDHDDKFSDLLKAHNETLRLIAKTIDQNNLVIHKIIAEKT